MTRDIKDFLFEAKGAIAVLNQIIDEAYALGLEVEIMITNDSKVELRFSAGSGSTAH